MVIIIYLKNTFLFDSKKMDCLTKYVTREDDGFSFYTQ